jgi:hypothetical protein
VLERRARTETWQAGKPLNVGTMTLVPIARVVLHATNGGGFVWLSASKEPQAIVVRDGDGTRTISTTASPVTLEMLRDDIADLDAVLAPPGVDPAAA